MRVPGIPYVQGRNDYSDGDARKFGIAIHNTSNNASDSDEASYARRRPDGVSSHLYVDGDSVTQSIDTHDRAGHAGSTHGNDHGIAVEITGANGWSRDKWLTSVAWDKIGAVLAKVIRHHWPDGSFKVRRASVAEMRRNPKVKAFYGHDDMRRAWGQTDHTDPGPNFPWDRLFAAVNEALGATPTPQPSGGDEMSWFGKAADVIPLWPPRATKTNRTAQAGWVLGRIGQWTDETRADVVRLRAGQEAILAAVQGDDSAAIIARIDALAAEVTARAEAEEARHAEMLALIQQGQDGTLDAADVVARMGELLTGASPPTT
jgi:N-acetyl-anhydromuramyl-L-alanine amidase AmpD